MSGITFRIAGLAATIALALGGLAVSALPAEAKIKGKGTFTTSEMRKVNRAMDRQKCLTRKKTRKIIKGNGSKSGSKIKWLARDYLDIDGTVYRDTFTVHDSHGCAWKTVFVDYDEGEIADESLYW